MNYKVLPLALVAIISSGCASKYDSMRPTTLNEAKLMHKNYCTENSNVIDGKTAAYGGTSSALGAKVILSCGTLNVAGCLLTGGAAALTGIEAISRANENNDRNEFCRQLEEKIK